MITLAEAGWIDRLTRLLGDELRQRRTDRGWTRQDLLNHLHLELSLQTLGTYELGTRHITVARLTQLARALGTTPAEIIACAYQRVFDELDTADGWTIDLDHATQLQETELAPFRRWATLQLRELPPTTQHTAWLSKPALTALATLCDLNPTDLLKQLPRRGFPRTQIIHNQNGAPPSNSPPAGL